jgi:hypothetical protein
LLYQVDQEACIAGVRDGGGVAAKRLNAPQTVAIQTASRISSAARISVARLLRAFLGCPVFADEAKCASVIGAHLTVQNFSKYYYTDVDEKTKEEQDKIQEYYVIDPFQAIINQLKTLRDSFPKEALGVTLGELGKCIAVCLQCDHGGGTMKFIALLLARVKDTQTVVVDLGRFKGKECHHILQNTVMPAIDSGFKYLSEHALAIVEWEGVKGGFDFVAVPKDQIEGVFRIRGTDGRLGVTWEGRDAVFEAVI